MVKPTKKKVLAKLVEIERRLKAGAPLDIVVMKAPGQLARVGYGAGGLFITMTARQALDMAKKFDTDEARAIGADRIGLDLAEAAAACAVDNARDTARGSAAND
ncbi:hypothetical protein [Brevundimonas naejangsanensis]|uniref:hypothetical protein n=1 Tax=Brevundimonas naejangsanensis TaxID=588932 RepID=UPI0026E98339|nr:hypothetical protein [Brevundimonas naejangsanensis]